MWIRKWSDYFQRLVHFEGHAIMDCPFVPFHIRAGNSRHVELWIAARVLMDQPQEQEP